MPTRSSQNWQQQPGYLHSLHLNDPFPSRSDWGIPQLARLTAAHLPDTLVAYGYRARPKEPLSSPATHFFLDDYRFEIVWRKPKKGLQFVQKYPFVLTPDFSLYRDWPLAAQLWNVYRNRWCGAYWQRAGLWVIPTVSWSSTDSFAFCFEGIPRGSVVAVSAIGTQWQTDTLGRHLFMDGFKELVRQLDPSVVIAYGLLPPECGTLVEVLHRPTDWQKRKQREQV